MPSLLDVPLPSERRRVSFSQSWIRFDHSRHSGCRRVSGLTRSTPRQCWAEDAVAVMDAARAPSSATIFAPGFTAMSALWYWPPTGPTAGGQASVIVNGAATGAVGARLSKPVSKATGLPIPYTTVVRRTRCRRAGFRRARRSVARQPCRRRSRVPRVVGSRRAVSAASPTHGPSSDEPWHWSDADVRDTPPAITAPTLDASTATGELDVRSGRARPGTSPSTSTAITLRRVARRGSRPCWDDGDSASILDEVEEFITPAPAAASAADRVLTTIVFTDIVGLDSGTRRSSLATTGGMRPCSTITTTSFATSSSDSAAREVNTVGDGFVAIFPEPSTAIDCADAIVDAVRPLGIEVRVGIHAGEVEVRGDDIAGMAVHIGARVAALAGPAWVPVSSTVREIVAGSRRSSPTQRRARTQGRARRLACTHSSARTRAVTH